MSEREEGMEIRKVFICIFVALLGVISFGTGFGAENTRTKASDVKVVSGECTYPPSPALGLGLTAALSLLIAQIIITVATGCMCCCRKSTPSSSTTTTDFNRVKGVVFFVLSWIAFVIAFYLLISGSLVLKNKQEDNKDRVHRRGFYYYCYFYVVKPKVFQRGAIIAAITVILGILSYLTLSSPTKNNTDTDNANNQIQGGVAMRQPQFPPQTNSHQPNFVLADANYNRQQLA